MVILDKLKSLKIDSINKIISSYKIADKSLSTRNRKDK